MTLATVAKVVCPPVLAAAVAIEIDPTRILSWAAGAALAVVVWFAQREWGRTTDRLDVLERDVAFLKEWRVAVVARAEADE